MEESKPWIRFRYCSAVCFFTLVILLNIVFSPMLQMIGLDKQLSLLIVNSLGTSMTLTVVILFMERKFQGKQHAIRFFFRMLLLCTAVSYYLLYL